MNRANHAGLNHLRSLKFGVKLMELFKDHNPELFDAIYPTNAAIAMGILSTGQESFLRVDEAGQKGAQVLDLDSFHTLFPGLDAERYFFNKPAAPHQLASAIWFKLMLDNSFGHLVPTADRSALAWGVQFHGHEKLESAYLGDNPAKVFAPGDDRQTPDFEYLKFFMDHAVTINGHYVDHCRMQDFRSLARYLPGTGGCLGSTCSVPSFAIPTYGSDYFDYGFAKEFFRLANIPEERLVVLANTVLKTLTETEHNHQPAPQVKNTTEFRKACNSLQGRRKHPRWQELSKNFDKAWETLKLENDIRSLLTKALHQ